MADVSTINMVINAAPVALKGLAYVCLGCSAFAALTPTPKDDSFFKTAYNVIDMLAGNFWHAKEK